MKILHACDWYRPFGGAERLLLGTLEALEAAGHENIIIANQFDSQAKTGQRAEDFLPSFEANFAILPSWRTVGKMFRNLRRDVEKIILRHRPDVIHVHNLQNPFALRTLSRCCPTVRSIHDPRLYCFTDWKLLPDKRICPHPFGRPCLTNGCLSLNVFKMSNFAKQVPFRLLHFREHRKVDVLIAESHAVHDCLNQNGFPDSQLALLPNYTETKGSWEEVAAFNKRYHRSNERVVVFVGRASYEKGMDALVEAMVLIPKPWKLILVTGGEYLSTILEKIKSLGIEDSVEMPGILDYETTRTYYARADVVVVPSVWMESFCLVGLEAMANGKPVVAFRTGGIPDWLDDGETGFLAPFKDVRILAAKIQKLLENRVLAEAMGRKGYERVSEVFTKEKYLSFLLQIYDSAIAKRRAVHG